MYRFRLHEHDPDVARVYDLRRDDEQMFVSPHFQLIELACNDGTPLVLVHPALLAVLEILRNRLGPLIVRSGYRTGAFNAAIGGAENSYHLKGMAADLASKTRPPADIEAAASAVDVGGLSAYNSFVHVDVGPRRRW